MWKPFFVIVKSSRSFIWRSTVVTPAYVRVSAVSAAAQSSSALWTRRISQPGEAVQGGQCQSSCRDSYLCLWSFHCPPSSPVLSHNTQPRALSVCPVVSHQFPHYSATYGWYQICIYAILWDFPISMFPTFRQLRHADSIFSSDGDWETESREYKLNELRLLLLQKIQTQTDWSEVFILLFQMFHLAGLIISHGMHAWQSLVLMGCFTMSTLFQSCSRYKQLRIGLQTWTFAVQ